MSFAEIDILLSFIEDYLWFEEVDYSIYFVLMMIWRYTCTLPTMLENVIQTMQ